MNINAINNQNAPSFGALVIKNRKLYAKYGRDIYREIKKNKDITEFAKNPDYDIVFSAKRDLRAKVVDFSYKINKKLTGVLDGINNNSSGNILFAFRSTKGDKSFSSGNAAKITHENLQNCMKPFIC